ncbi:hypothetical protein GCM10027443_14790 [Pontibacter brevis]
MAISINYRFLFRIGGWSVLATALLSVLLMKVLEHHAEVVPVLGQKSMAIDLLTFSFALGFILNLISTKLTHIALKKRKVLPLHWHLKSQTLVDRLPQHLLHRAFMLGLAGLLVACLTLFLFRLREVEQLPYQEYLLIFSLHAVLLAGAVTVMSVYRGLGDYTLIRQGKTKSQSTSAV